MAGKLAYLLQNEEDLSTFREALNGVVESVADTVAPIPTKLVEMQSALEDKIDALPAPLDFSQQIDKVATAIHRRLDAIKFPEIPKPEKVNLDLKPVYELFQMQAKALNELKALVVDLAAREYEVNIPDDRPREWEFKTVSTANGYTTTAKAK